MAVQKSRVSHSRKGMRNSHRKLSQPTLAVEPTTGEMHRRHHVSKSGFYKGRQVFVKKQNSDSTEE